MLNRLFRLVGRAYASLSADFLAYVIVPASIFLIAAALYPEEFDEKLLSASNQMNISLPMPSECGGKLGMEVGNVKIFSLKIERTYWNRKCASFSASLHLFEVGVQYNDRPIQVASLITIAGILPDVKQAYHSFGRVFKEATLEDLSIIKNGKCQWLVKRDREDTTFGLVCPRPHRSAKML